MCVFINTIEDLQNLSKIYVKRKERTLTDALCNQNSMVMDVPFPGVLSNAMVAL